MLLANLQPSSAWKLLLLFVVLPLACYVLSRQELNLDKGHFERGLSSYLSGDFQKALDQINRAIADAPNDSTCFHLRGNIYFELEQYERAVDDYSKAIQLRSDDATAFGNRGWCYRQLGQYERALADWQECNLLLSLPSTHEHVVTHKAVASTSTRERQVQ